jgi:hypothetical protein
MACKENFVVRSLFRRKISKGKNQHKYNHTFSKRLAHSYVYSHGASIVSSLLTLQHKQSEAVSRYTSGSSNLHTLQVGLILRLN